MALWETQEGPDICIVRGESLFQSLHVVTFDLRFLVSANQQRSYILGCIEVTEGCMKVTADQVDERKENDMYQSFFVFRTIPPNVQLKLKLQSASMY